MKASTSKVATAAMLAVGRAQNPAPPARTVPVDAALYGFTPLPTDPPSMGMMARARLDARQDESLVTIQYNNDNTCGYISGSRGAAFSCVNTNAYCALYTSHDNIPGRMACCDAVECHFQVTCIDYEQYTDNVCQGPCLTDTLTAKCTDSKYPYCNTVSFSGGVIDFACGLNSNSRPQVISTTYLGQTVGGSYQPFVITDTSTSLKPIPTSTPAASSSSGSSSSSSNQDGSTDGGSDDSDSGGKKKKGTPVGPIVGGVVGGVGAIGVAALAFVFLRRHKKKKQEAAGQQNASPYPPAAAPAMQQHGGSPPPPSQHHTSYYDPKFGAAPHQQQQPYNSHSSYQSSSPGYHPSMYSPDPNSPQGGQGMLDPRTGQPLSTSPSLSYANTNASSPPPQMQQPYQPSTSPQQYQPSTSPQQINNAYNAPPIAGAQYPATSPRDAPAGAVHEAPTDISDQHRGEMHELA